MSPAVTAKLVVVLSALVSLVGTLLLPDVNIDPAYAHGISLALLTWLLNPPGKVKPPVLPLLAVLLLAGCPTPPLQTWPQYLECAPGVHEIIGTVSRILLDGPADERDLKQRGKDELQQLAFTHGADVVACTVDKLVRDWRKPGSTLTPETIAASVRGENFLRGVGVER